MTITHDIIQVEEMAILANELADVARETAMSFFRTEINIELKSDTSPVTIADKTAEQALRQKIMTAYPDHAIVGEEFDSLQGSTDNCWRWTLDPIDGTRAFIAGVPLFGSLIALQHQDDIVLGIIEMPALKERFVAYKTDIKNNQYQSYFLSASNERHSLQTSSTSLLQKSRLFATDPSMFDATQKQRFDALSANCALTRYGADCYGYGLLAIGHSEIVAEADMKPYDYRALVPIIEAAGGIITDWQGNSLNDNYGTSTILATANSDLHQQALQHLNN